MFNCRTINLFFTSVAFLFLTCLLLLMSDFSIHLGMSYLRLVWTAMTVLHDATWEISCIRLLSTSCSLQFRCLSIKFELYAICGFPPHFEHCAYLIGDKALCVHLMGWRCLSAISGFCFQQPKFPVAWLLKATRIFNLLPKC